MFVYMRKIALAEGELQDLFGVHDENLRHLESDLDITVSARDREVFLEGDDERVDIAAKVLTELSGLIAKGYELKDKDCLLYTSQSPRDVEESRMPSSA